MSEIQFEYGDRIGEAIAYDEEGNIVEKKYFNPDDTKNQ